jgi:FkbM family methyltransferase
LPAYTADRWDGLDVLNYEHCLISALAEAASACSGPVTIVDCGANIGLISVFLAARLDQVSRLIAFEPSPETFPVLRQALAGLPIEAEAIQMAVSDFDGRGELRSPAYDSSDTARYVVQVPEGGFPVTTVDALSLQAANLLIKIDVEGGEIGVIRGASRSLAEADKAILSIEAHPKVFQRTGIDPITILREIAAIRPFQFTVAETGESNLDLSRPFFEQQPNDGTVYNIICISR